MGSARFIYLGSKPFLSSNLFLIHFLCFLFLFLFLLLVKKLTHLMENLIIDFGFFLEVIQTTFFLNFFDFEEHLGHLE